MPDQLDQADQLPSLDQTRLRKILIENCDQDYCAQMYDFVNDCDLCGLTEQEVFKRLLAAAERKEGYLEQEMSSD